MDREVRAPEAVPVCHRCFLPLEYESSRWFCFDCGAAVGPYNNILPFIRIFSMGEVLRSGVRPEAPFTTFTVCGYVLVGYTQFWLLSPLYIFRLCRNLWLKKKSAETEGEDAGGKTYGRLLGVALVLSALLLTATSLTLWSFMGKTRAAPVRIDDMDPSDFPRGAPSPFVSASPTNGEPVDIRFQSPIHKLSSTLPTQRLYRINVDSVSR